MYMQNTWVSLYGTKMAYALTTDSRLRVNNVGTTELSAKESDLWALFHPQICALVKSTTCIETRFQILKSCVDPKSPILKKKQRK
jgi:hypothetical protein